MPSPLFVLRRVALLGALGWLAGCDRGSAEADREALRRGLQSDEQVVEALRAVDDLALKGKPQEAAALLGSGARPASQRSAALVQGLSAGSPWGKERLQELRKLTADRAASLDHYESALRGELIEKVVEALEEQKSLDRRGAALATALGRPAAP